MVKRKQKRSKGGFSPVKFIIVIVVVTVLALAGWYVYDHRSNHKSSVTSSSGRPIRTIQTYAGWKTYTTNFGVSFKYPADWFVLTSPDMAGVDVQGINDLALSFHPARKDLPQYKDNLVLSVYEIKPDAYSPWSLSATGVTILDASFPINGQKFCLLGYHSSGLSSPITSMKIAECSGNGIGKGDFIPDILMPGTQGTFLILEFTSIGDGKYGGPGYAINQSSNDYETVLSILQSVTY